MKKFYWPKALRQAPETHKRLSFFFQKTIAWITIGGTIVSLCLTILVVWLTVKYGRLAQKYGENREQLDTLISMLKVTRHQDSLAISLERVAIDQDSLTLTQNGNIKDILSDIGKQLSLDAQALSIASAHFRLANSNSDVERRADFFKLKNIFTSAQQTDTSLKSEYGTPKYDLATASNDAFVLGKMQLLSQRLEQGFTNPFLQADTIMFRKWYDMYNVTVSLIAKITDINSHKTITFSYSQAIADKRRKLWQLMRKWWSQEEDFNHFFSNRLLNSQPSQ
jgi:hypothetical protein